MSGSLTTHYTVSSKELSATENYRQIAKSPDSQEPGDKLLNRGKRGDKGTRTPDPLHAMQVRYQLRHIPIFC